MKIKFKIRLFSFFVVAVLCIGVITILSISSSQSVTAHAYNCECDGNYCGECDDNALGDVLYGSSAYNLEQNYQTLLAQSGIIQTKSLQNSDSCNEYSTTCGPGRENGYSSNFLSTGCRNWEGWSYGNYGVTDIPYWINMGTMDTIANVTHRTLLIDDIRTQAALWNEAVMHDGTGQILNLYEVGIGSATLPDDINGHRVVEVLRLDGSYAGQFKPPASGSPSIEVRFNYDATGSGDRPGRNIDTPLHEFGHLLGLNDLDADLPSTSWPTHLTLMGYNRGTTATTLDSAIKYQDIQGIAALNNRHTTHIFNRYAVDGGNYLHFCYYCDSIDARNSPMSGSLPFVDSSTCAHEYDQLVSAGNRHWLKCRNCYKVVESEFDIKGVSSGGNVTIEILGLLDANTINVTIPSQIGGQDVTSIGERAFFYENAINSVVIPNTVTQIGTEAFSHCINLNSVNIPSSVTSIGTSVFNGCTSLTNIALQSGITHISDNTFNGCTSLLTVSIPSSVTTIGANVFSYCSSLRTISVASSNTVYASQNGILYDNAKTSFVHIPQALAGSVSIPTGINEIGDYAFADRIGLQSITLTGNIESIGSGAFWGSGLTAITIPSSVASIGSYAFCECTSLATLTLTSGVGNINESAFSGCSVLASLNIPGTVGSLGYNAFKNCSNIDSVVLQQGVSSIGEYAFSGCTDLTAVTIPQSVTSIGSNTFASCPSLSSLTWYYNPSYSAMDLNIRLYLTNVLFNSTITTIGEDAFWDCPNLTAVTIPTSVMSIGERAFCLLGGLAQILIPSSVTIMGTNAFSACSSLKIYSEASSKPSGWDVNWNTFQRPVYYYSAVSKVNCWRYVNHIPTIWYVEGTQGLEYNLLNDETFSVIGINTLNVTTLVIPSTYNGLPISKVGDGSVALNNSQFLQTVVINNGAKSIEASAFYGCNWLSSVTIPNSVMSIGASAFQNCIRMSINIPSSVTSIGASAFSGCTDLTALTIPQSVVSIGAGAFANCSPLSIVWNYNPALTAATFCSYYYTVSFPAGTSHISENAFANSPWLPIMTIPNTITSVGANAFANCASSLSVTWNYNPALTAATFSSYLTKVNFGSGLSSITANAFANCTNLPSISIPSTVTSIGNNAFNGCTRLQNISIPNVVTSIGSNAFNGCTGITYITIPYSVTSVGTNAFAGNANYIVSWNYNPSLTAENFGSVLQYVYWQSGLTYFPANAFKGCTRFASFSIPSSVTSIGSSAFYGCTGFNKIYISSNVTTMGTDVFQNCSNLYIYTGATSKPNGWNSNWNNSDFPVYWRVNSNATDVFSGFGYNGSTYYWNGAVQMKILTANNFYHTTNNTYLFNSNSEISFTVRTLSSRNAWSTINGSLAFELKNSAGTVIQTHNSSVTVSKTSTVTISSGSFSINTTNLSNGTYTLTMTSNFTRASWSGSSTHTLTFVVDK